MLYSSTQFISYMNCRKSFSFTVGNIIQILVIVSQQHSLLSQLKDYSLSYKLNDYILGARGSFSCYAKQSKIQVNAFYHYSGVTTSLQATVVIFSRFSGERRETRDMRGDHDIVVFLAPRVHLALAPFSLLEKKRVLLFSKRYFPFYRQTDKQYFVTSIFYQK